MCPPNAAISPLQQIKVQAVTRGWLARRLARVLLLRGGCRRELDVATGAWQYVWSYRTPSDAPAAAATTTDGSRRGYGGGGDHPSSPLSPGGGCDAGGGLFRSWNPPAMLKRETLPSPRAAVRRVEGEQKKREARLALANFLLDDQKGQVRSDQVWLSLGLVFGWL